MNQFCGPVPLAFNQQWVYQLALLVGKVEAVRGMKPVESSRVSLTSSGISICRVLLRKGVTLDYAYVGMHRSVDHGLRGPRL